MKKMMIYLLATALAYGLAVSQVYAQGIPIMGQGQPFVLPPPPPVHALKGCWSFMYMANYSTDNKAMKIDGHDYLEIQDVEGGVAHGTMYSCRDNQWSLSESKVIVNGSTLSGGSITSEMIAGTSRSICKYMIGTLTEEDGTLVVYGTAMLSNWVQGDGYVNHMSFFKATHIQDASTCESFTALTCTSPTPLP